MFTEDAAGAAAFVPGVIQVDVDGLDDFAELLLKELESNLKPTSHRIIVDHGAGVGFGENHASVNMQEARAKYLLCLQRSVDNLICYIAVSEILVVAVRQAATTYRNTDARSAAG